MNTDIKNLTMHELKALAYDELAKFESARNNIQLLNNEIMRKTKVEQELKTQLEKSKMENQEEVKQEAAPTETEASEVAAETTETAPETTPEITPEG